jgi:hypothetical protein
MSILKVANVHFDSAGTNRIAYGGSDNILRVTSGAVKLPVGDTAGRPTAEVGLIRYNSQIGTFEGRGADDWGPIGGGSAFSSNVVISVADNSNAALRITQTGTADALRVEDSSNPDSTPFVVDAVGNVLIGRTDSTIGNGVKLDVNGKINSAGILVDGVAFQGGAALTDQTDDSTQYLTFTTSTSGTAASLNVASERLTFNPSLGVLSATIFNSTSDINKKTNITQITDAVTLVNSMNGVRFDWKDNGLPSLGVIAQEVEKVLPELVSDEKSVNYNGLIAVLIEAVKELSRKVEELESR